MCGPNSHLKLETTSTHFKKDHSTQNSACSNKKTAPRPCVGANLCRNIAPGHNANGKHKAAHQRPSQRPLSQPTIAADWSSGTARSARRIRRLLILPDVPQRGANEPRPVLLGEGLGGGRGPFQCGWDVLWAQGGHWGKGAPAMDAPLACGSFLGPDAKSHLRPRGAKRGAGSVMGSRGGAGRARVPPQIRKPAPYQPYPHSRTHSLTTVDVQSYTSRCRRMFAPAATAGA